MIGSDLRDADAGQALKMCHAVGGSGDMRVFERWHGWYLAELHVNQELCGGLK